MTEKPRITVVTPSFNQAAFLEETLRSVHEQGYPNLEHIVVDGGSTDGSVDLIRQFEPKLAYWVSEPDRGQCHAINKGMTRATGEIACWLNSDDTLEPGSLYAVAEHFLQNPDWGALVGGSRCVDERGRTIDLRTRQVVTGDPEAEAIRWCCREKGSECLTCWSRDWFSQPSTFWRRRVWEQVGGLDETLNYSMDYELWRRMAKVTEIHPVQDVLATYRFHSEAKCALDVWGPFREVIEINEKVMDDQEFRRFSSYATRFLLEQLCRQTDKKGAVTEQLDRVLRSSAYRLGNRLTQPLRFVRRVLGSRSS